jgi:hypothetical protein
MDHSGSKADLFTGDVNGPVGEKADPFILSFEFALCQEGLSGQNRQDE